MGALGTENLAELVRKTILREFPAEPVRDSGSGYGRTWSGDFRLPSGLLIHVNLERTAN